MSYEFTESRKRAFDLPEVSTKFQMDNTFIESHCSLR